MTTEELLETRCSPFQKTFEPDGDNLYIEKNVNRMMELYALQFISWLNIIGATSIGSEKWEVATMKYSKDYYSTEELYEIFKNIEG